jgi:hypothetical protein
LELQTKQATQRSLSRDTKDTSLFLGLYSPIFVMQHGVERKAPGLQDGKDGKEEKEKRLDGTSNIADPDHRRTFAATPFIFTDWLS